MHCTWAKPTGLAGRGGGRLRSKAGPRADSSQISTPEGCPSSEVSPSARTFTSRHALIEASLTQRGYGGRLVPTLRPWRS